MGRMNSKHPYVGKPGPNQQVLEISLVEGKAGHWFSVTMLRSVDLVR